LFFQASVVTFVAGGSNADAKYLLLSHETDFRHDFSAARILVEHCSNLNAGLGLVWLLFLAKMQAAMQGSKGPQMFHPLSSVILLKA